jgi:hypothetical protein
MLEGFFAMARSRLFHAIVVMGLSTVACGDGIPAPPAEAGADAKPASDAAAKKDGSPVFGDPDAATPPDAAAAGDAGGIGPGPCGFWPCYV